MTVKKEIRSLMLFLMVVLSVLLVGCSGETSKDDDTREGTDKAVVDCETSREEETMSNETKDFKIFGTSLSEYVISYRKYVSDGGIRSKSKDVAEALKSRISDTLGITLRVACTEELGESEKYILILADSMNVCDWSVTTDNENITLAGSNASIDAAVDAFIGDYLKSDRPDGELDAKTLSGKLEYEIPYSKADMMRLFNDVYNDDTKVISGCHTYGDGNGSDIKRTDDEFIEKTGKRAAILELDMGVYSVYTPWHKGSDHLDDETLSRIVSEALSFVSDGGIVSVCIHMANPLMNASDEVFYRGQLGSDEVARDMLTDGTELNGGLRKTLEPTVRLLEALRDNGIPFMFRPLHEMNGGWFWWCVNQGENKISQETMRDFWMFFYRLVTEELGIDNAVWVYAPNYNGGGCADVLYAYPGNNYVDLVGVDWYTFGNYEFDNDESYTKVMSTGKPAALTEVGPSESGTALRDDDGKLVGYSYNASSLLRDLKTMAEDGYKITYFLTWARSLSAAQLDGGDELMNDEMVLTVEDLAEYWRK